ncbi:hypothetical protein Y032_0342g3022 [Ancylostoma ceylanicum]|uniref:Uncharacterized protein n=1 Tax=Ancylostoma ceylanicum TaxID=53326 RepID=A0A016RYG3_9BILA|nr:hypothetical protein Y032_0342g3022 [Ancylostoma ceylanicum]
MSHHRPCVCYQTVECPWIVAVTLIDTFATTQISRAPPLGTHALLHKWDRRSNDRAHVPTPNLIFRSSDPHGSIETFYCAATKENFIIRCITEI